MPLQIEITSAQVRRVVVAVALGVAGGFVVLLVFDLFRPLRGPSFSIAVSYAEPIVVLLALFSLGVFLAGKSLLRRQTSNQFGQRLRRIGFTGGLVFLLPIWLMALEWLIYNPLKFAYLIHRVEHAQTVEAERAAFRLAHRWGFVWEMDRLTKREWWPEHKRHLEGPWLLKLEWLESSGWTLKPYRAYRVVLDERNFEVMARK